MFIKFTTCLVLDNYYIFTTDLLGKEYYMLNYMKLPFLDKKWFNIDSFT